jgi:hypothetical protein
MNTEMITIANEDLAEKKSFLVELTTRIQSNIDNWDAKEIQKTINTMNNVTLEIAQLEMEIKFRKRMEK